MQKIQLQESTTALYVVKRVLTCIISLATTWTSNQVQVIFLQKKISLHCLRKYLWSSQRLQSLIKLSQDRLESVGSKLHDWYK